jgi:hypothetical protein
MSYIVISEAGPACPRCGRPLQVREHGRIRAKQLRQPYYYSRWFCCTHSDCKTTTVTRDDFKVWSNPTDAAVHQTSKYRSTEWRARMCGVDPRQPTRQKVR